MKASELVSKLTTLITDQGDLEVMVPDSETQPIPIKGIVLNEAADDDSVESFMLADEDSFDAFSG
jgi:hypothetical protein